jgi:arginase
MRISLLDVPYDLGADGQGAARAAESLASTSARSLDITLVTIARGTRFRDTGSASLAVNRELARAVGDMVARGQVPVVIAGSCDVSLGVMGGFDHEDCGIVWFDAHGDFNTPDTTVTGFFGGMPLAVLTGRCYANLWRQVGDSRPVSDSSTLLVGARDLDPLERQLLDTTKVSVCGCDGGRPESIFTAMLEDLRPKVRQVYLHFDMDVLDPIVAPALDLPVSNGLSIDGATEAVRAVADRFEIRAVAITTTFNPDRDTDGRTLRAGLTLIEQLTALQ